MRGAVKYIVNDRDGRAGSRVVGALSIQCVVPELLPRGWPRTPRCSYSRWGRSTVQRRNAAGVDCHEHPRQQIGRSAKAPNALAVHLPQLGGICCRSAKRNMVWFNG